MKTCQNEAYTISISEDSIFTPNSSTANGINATDGIGRRNSTVEFVTFRRKLDEPMMKPSTTASTTAINRPSSHASMVSPTANQKAVSPKSSNSIAMTSDAGGKNRASTIPTRGTSSHTSRNAKIPASPSNCFVGRFLAGRRRDRLAAAPWLSVVTAGALMAAAHPGAAPYSAHISFPLLLPRGERGYRPLVR